MRIKLSTTSFINKLLLATIAIISLSPVSLIGQVTIGNLKQPVSGAILQLKEDETTDGANSKRGMGMPRVEIKDATSLDNVLTDAEKAANPNHRQDHTGLMVYNPNECSVDGNGLYVWSGVYGIS